MFRRVVGNVPELTLKAARIAACSAGGKVVGAYPNKLRPEHVRAIAAGAVDIVLLAGGTDGGDEERVLRNARTLAEGELQTAVIYAGNADCRDEALDILSRGGVLGMGAPNLLPHLDRPNYEGARKAIAELFMTRIIEGKGLAELATRCADELRPTPAAVFDLVAELDGDTQDGGLILVDLGGATTDLYSACEPFSEYPGRVFRGIREPRLKRSVEGDLGLRHSAIRVMEAVEALEEPRGTMTPEYAGMRAWATLVSKHPETLPLGADQEAADRFLATRCLSLALARHAGRGRPSWTAQGEIMIQTGKDLGSVSTLIGSGGYLAEEASGTLVGEALREAAGAAARMGEDGGVALLPQAVTVLRDQDYLIPLAANLVRPFPEAAAHMAREGLREVGTTNGGAQQ